MSIQPDDDGLGGAPFEDWEPSDPKAPPEAKPAAEPTNGAAKPKKAKKARPVVRQPAIPGLLHKRDDDGSSLPGLRNIIANAVTVLAGDPRWTGVFAYDEFAETIVTRKAPPWRAVDAPTEVRTGDWTDEDMIRTQCWLSDQFDIDLGLEAVLSAVKVVAHKARVHPVRDWLIGLRWDGKKRGASWLVDVFGCEDTPYVRSVGQAFLVACIARIMRPGCKVDTVPILEGEQGIGKSSCLRALAGDEWFLEMSISDVTNVDAMQVLRRKWIAEMPEIDGWSRSETSHFKGYVSRQVDTYRASYGRGSRDYPRQCCFIGTTNAREYLKDETGNRRFQPLACRRGDVAMVEPCASSCGRKLLLDSRPARSGMCPTRSYSKPSAASRIHDTARTRGSRASARGWRSR